MLNKNLTLTISIVTYNSKHVIAPCLDSIISTVNNVDYEIIVVDNASTDATAKYIKNNYPSVTLIANTENIGFGRAHNQAFKNAKGQFFLILNPDTIIHENTIERLIDFMCETPEATLCGCKIYWDDNKGFQFPDLKLHNLMTAILHFTPFLLHFPKSHAAKTYWQTAYKFWAATKPIEVEAITGGFMLIKSNVYETIAGFDEGFFLFFEEHDLMRRINKAGYKIYYLPDVSIQHYFEESCRHSSMDIGKIYTQSAFYYYKKHYGTFGTLFIRSLFKLNKIIQRQKAKGKMLSKYEKKGFQRLTPNSNGDIVIESKQPSFIVEIAYSPEFADRGGMFVNNSMLTLNNNILNRLPNNKGFLRIFSTDEIYILSQM
ncbi:MAG: glycosyltransferase family 2 protein [Candidatus Magnetoovum sp. WYHC-5]|nr:glycosyltransferase family 2 protein [Candidatus Magnetoovum sp. WYHC-5]